MGLAFQVSNTIKYRLLDKFTPTTKEQHTMSAGFGKAIIAAHMLAEKRDYIKSRADYIGWSQSMMFEKIIDYWLSKGAPALHGRDKVTPVPKFKEKQELDQRRYRYKAKPAK